MCLWCIYSIYYVATTCLYCIYYMSMMYPFCIYYVSTTYLFYTACLWCICSVSMSHSVSIMYLLCMYYMPVTICLRLCVSATYNLGCVHSTVSDADLDQAHTEPRSPHRPLKGQALTSVSQAGLQDSIWTPGQPGISKLGFILNLQVTEQTWGTHSGQENTHWWAEVPSVWPRPVSLCLALVLAPHSRGWGTNSQGAVTTTGEKWREAGQGWRVGADAGPAHLPCEAAPPAPISQERKRRLREPCPASCSQSWLRPAQPKVPGRGLDSWAGINEWINETHKLKKEQSHQPQTPTEVFPGSHDQVKGREGEGGTVPRESLGCLGRGREDTHQPLSGQRTQLLQVSRFLKSRLRLKTALVIKHTQEAGFSLRLSLLKGFKNLSGAGGGGKPQAVTTKFWCVIYIYI